MTWGTRKKIPIPAAASKIPHISWSTGRFSGMPMGSRPRVLLLQGEASFNPVPYLIHIIPIAMQMQDFFNIYPNVAKVGRLHSRGAKGEAVVVYCESVATQDPESSGVPGG
jgi:hypothetical protein